MSYTTGMNDSQVGFLRPLGFAKPALLEQLSDLLAFILINFAAKSIYGKSPHNVI
jgi:hypothetical protein